MIEPRYVMKNFSPLLIIVACLILSGCGTINNSLVEKSKSVEYYRIFDIKTEASRYIVADAASNGLGKNVNDAQEARPIPTESEPPTKPGRFKLEDPFKGSRLGVLASGAGNIGFKVATCDGAVWSAKAIRDIDGDSNLTLTACLFEYKGGYHLDLYAVFGKTEGGIMEISRKMAHAMVGTPEQWVEKTFLDIVREIKKQTGAEITFVEGYPAPSGTPWLDTE